MITIPVYSFRGIIFLVILIISRINIPKKLFAKIDLVLDKLKSITTLYLFAYLRLYPSRFFCFILEKIVCKGFLFKSLSLKLAIGLAFAEKFFEARKILKGKAKSWIWGKIVASVVD